MPSPPALRRIDKQQFPEAPEWFGRFLEQLNPFLIDVTSALTARLAIEQNVLAQVGTLVINTGDDVSTAFPRFVSLKFRPRTFQIVGAKNLTLGPNAIFVTSPGSTHDMTTGGVNLRYVSGLDANSKFEITFLAFG